MRAVRCDGAGDVDVLRWAEVDDPTPGPGEVLVRVVASAVNRADLMQRQGFYPPPPGVTDTLGLECSGTVVALGDGVDSWSVGDEVCCLLAGGGNAELAVVPAAQVMPLPDGIDLETAGALPEVACTVWSNVVTTGRLSAGETLLVHGGASGIGTTAIQVGTALGARVIATAGSDRKLELCRSLGADVTVNYRDADFVEAVKEATEGAGVDVILDIVGAKYLARNLDALADSGRLVVIGMQGGTTAEVDLNAMLRKRATLAATSLRSRSLTSKAQVVADTVAGVWPMVANGRVRVVIEDRFPMSEVAEAHRLVGESGHVGKVLLTVPG
jgi:putative PIG3 family NAD(P)H quinone oxidoreductase